MNSLGVFANILGAANTAAVMFTNEASCNMSQPGPTTVPVAAVLVLVYSYLCLSPCHRSVSPYVDCCVYVVSFCGHHYVFNWAVIRAVTVSMPWFLLTLTGTADDRFGFGWLLMNVPNTTDDIVVREKKLPTNPSNRMRVPEERFEHLFLVKENP